MHQPLSQAGLGNECESAISTAKFYHGKSSHVALGIELRHFGKNLRMCPLRHHGQRPIGRMVQLAQDYHGKSSHVALGIELRHLGKNSRTRPLRHNGQRPIGRTVYIIELILVVPALKFENLEA